MLRTLMLTSLNLATVCAITGCSNVVYFSEGGVEVGNFRRKQVVYANRDLDLCILELADEQRAELDQR